MSLRRFLLVLLLTGTIGSSSFLAATPIQYRFSFPEPEHRWMQVEASFFGLGSAPLELRMSRASPGRYSLHDFAKNVYDVRAFDAAGREISTTRPDPHGWTVVGHGGSATIRYKVFGDYVDGTYLAVDPTHAHINMPAAIMWARGLDDQPVTLTLDPPVGRRWQVATQLQPGGTPFTFLAPNLQYLMDSPVEFGPLSFRSFSVGDRRIRLAVHHMGTDADLDAFTADVAKIVREHGQIYGEYPEYEPGHYTFIADVLPWSMGDAMEHRNSTVITLSGGLRNDRIGLLQSVSHEFAHGWNVERIRPRSLEPFDFERANMSDELWLAEGFTQYYGALVLHRSRLVDLERIAGTFGGFVASVANNPARLVRSAVEMSRMAPFVDDGRPVDRTNWSSTVISYYSFGAAVALALDLTLRERSDGAVTLDDFMRAMWRAHGSPGGSRPGYVDRPYTMADAEAQLAEVSGDPAFARDFFRRHIEGYEVADYRRLLMQAGFVLRPERPGVPWLGNVGFQGAGDGVRLVSSPSFGSPLYLAGLDIDDKVLELDRQAVRSVRDVTTMLGRYEPGDTIAVLYVDRSGVTAEASMTLGEDPGFSLRPIEAAGAVLTPRQKRFRDGWLN